MKLKAIVSLLVVKETEKDGLIWLSFGFVLSSQHKTKKMKKSFLIIQLFLLSLLPSTVVGQDSLRWSLLTCQPSQEIYQLFGHTALRCENYSRKLDLVFNYGMFSFNTPNFVMRFVKGETDYQLGVEEYADFLRNYQNRNSGVIQQTLNLTQQESNKLWQLLVNNARPENRIYRYNYFYNNCTSKARDMIEQCLDGKVVYPNAQEGKSFRSIIHEYTKGSEWDELGIDLLLGQEADEKIGAREQMFAPFYLSDYLRKATINSGGETRPLVIEETNVLNFNNDPIWKGFPLSPVTCAWILFVIALGIANLEVWNKTIYWIWDVLIFGIQGIAGLIIGFLMFFSTHPTVDSNWMFMLFNPIPLLYLPIMIWKDWKKKEDFYHIINIVYLIIFIILMYIVPQTFNAAVLPLALSLLITSVAHWLVYRFRS